MKKWVSLVLALTMMALCTFALAEGIVFGLGSVTNRSDTPGDKEDGKNNRCEFNTTFAAVAMDLDGRFIWVKFDVAQNRVDFDFEGNALPAPDEAFPTKAEKLFAYNMKNTSASRGNINVNEEPGGEWFEQAAFFEAYCVGKTLEEVISGVAIGEDNYPTGPDVLAGITIHINEFIEALHKAVADAK